MNYVYNKEGHIVAFIEDDNAFLIDGTHLGFMKGDKVYDLSGQYIGTYNSDLEMILIKEGEISSFPKIQTTTLVKRVNIVIPIRRVAKVIPVGYECVL